MNIIISFSMLCLLIIIGKTLRIKLKFLQKLYIPSSVIGGIIGLIILQIFGNNIPKQCTLGWNAIPGFLINIVFATLFLGISIPPIKAIWKKSGPQLAYGQIVAWGQYMVAIIVTILILKPIFSVPSFFGVIVPVGFEGGHGTAAGLRNTFEIMGWTEGADFGLASATFGIISAIICGMFLVNWAVRKNATKCLKKIENMEESNVVGVYPVNKRPVLGYQTVSADSIDTLGIHIAIVGMALLIGLGLKKIILLFEYVFPTLESTKILEGFPLFPLCMIGGLIIQIIFDKYIKYKLIDHNVMQRIGGTCLDFLVVAAIATIKISVILKFIVPFFILVAVGIAWNMFCVMYLAKRLLPNAWFERSIAEMGQSMGVTATGLLLLRVTDPETKTEAYEAFGYKQLLHEPFMGGGLWTSIAIPLAILKGPLVILIVSITAIVLWLIVWRLLFFKNIVRS